MYTRFSQAHFIKMAQNGKKPVPAKPAKPAKPAIAMATAAKPASTGFNWGSLSSAASSMLGGSKGSDKGSSEFNLTIDPKAIAKQQMDASFARLSSKSVPARAGLTGYGLTVPDLIRSGMTDIQKQMFKIDDKTSTRDLFDLKGKNPGFAATMRQSIPGALLSGPGKFLTPQNVNRAAMLGGTIAGGRSGGNTFRSYGAAGLGSVAGNLGGTYLSEGINSAIDSFQGRKSPSYIRRAVLDTLLGSGAAIAGGYYAGKATR
jgi:hypothetical protein